MDKDFMLVRALLTLLDTEQRWFTFAEMEKELGVSDKTIRKLVEELSQQLPTAMAIEVSRGRGMILHRDRRSTTIQEVIALLFKQTSYYRFMHLLFMQGGHIRAEEIAESLYMSASSFKKFIVQLNNHELQAFRLRITYAAPALKGHEIHIRYFLWKLFCEANAFTGWPFPNTEFDTLNQYITEIETENRIVYFLNSKRNLAFLIAIVLERVRQGHTVHIEEGRYRWSESQFYSPLLSLVRKLEETYRVTLPKDEVFFLISLFSLSQYNSHDAMLPTSDSNPMQANLMTAMRDRLLPLLMQSFKTLDMDERFIQEMGEFFEKLIIDNAIPELMQVSQNHLTTYAQHACQHVYDEVQRCMVQWNELYCDIHLNEFHLTKLTLLVSSSLRYKSKNAFLIIGEEFSVRHYVANLIKKEIGDELTIHTTIMEGLTDDIVRQRQIDFIISTFPLSIKSVPTVMIATIPTRRDLDNIRQELLM
ncbi:helix-turn-helix domain-containing protein [Paenibacillus guangzhouensis]|uniref:helix-turn-helix domain-containing protein n=1 Tax=Paenibacillus guangzhouensis TaxID=1473112 RepID=UPI001266D574|nr:helix-turn-helix domain-containing protein [Paenibacillus guangzhouensis]